MKLWLLTQEENNGYDTYDSAVVAAETKEEAQCITPDGIPFNNNYGTWASTPANVSAKYLGTAARGTKVGVVLASFNAG